MDMRMILVDSCENCIQLEKPDGQRYCIMGDRPCPEDGIPEWCPLPKMPEQESATSIYQLRKFAEEKGIPGPQAAGWKMGWNACLKAILTAMKGGECDDIQIDSESDPAAQEEDSSALSAEAEGNL